MAQTRPSLAFAGRMCGSLPCALVVVATLCASPVECLAQVEASAAADGVSAKVWLGREDEFERYLVEAEPVQLEPIGTGVTKPFKAELDGLGPVAAFAWKPIRPGVQGGYWESYKAEVAAYELDKLLGLGMVPVTVGRRIERVWGAASMWVSPTQTFSELGGLPKPPKSHFDRWNIQLVRAKMFDNLIYNSDPNLGNWLVDPAWNIILIDHSRAFTTTKRMAHPLSRVDGAMWERFLALNEERLTEVLGALLTQRQIRSILKRRDLMAKTVAELVAKKGEKAALLRYDEPIR